jgi:hypothetical protein
MLSRSASERISLCFFALASTRIGVWRSRVWEATGIVERYAALEMLQEVPGIGRVTVGGDKGFDTADFVRECRNLHMTPRVAQNWDEEAVAPSMDVPRNTRATASARRKGSASKNVLAG